MRVKLVEVTRHDNGWKGTWYRTGQRHFVTICPSWPDVVMQKYAAIDTCGGINESDCREVRGIVAWVRCVWKTVCAKAKAVTHG